MSGIISRCAWLGHVYTTTLSTKKKENFLCVRAFHLYENAFWGPENLKMYFKLYHYSFCVNYRNVNLVTSCACVLQYVFIL